MHMSIPGRNTCVGGSPKAGQSCFFENQTIESLSVGGRVSGSTVSQLRGGQGPGHSEGLGPVMTAGRSHQHALSRGCGECGLVFITLAPG